MSGRTDIQQRLIRLIDRKLPATGYPERILTDDTHGVLVIHSSLHLLYLDYTHPDYRQGRRTRVTVYDLESAEVLSTQDLRYPCLHLVLHPRWPLLLVSTMIGWDSYKGQLVLIDYRRDSQRELADKDRPVYKCRLDERGERLTVTSGRAVYYHEEEIYDDTFDFAPDMVIRYDESRSQCRSPAEVEALDAEIETFGRSEPERLEQLLDIPWIGGTSS